MSQVKSQFSYRPLRGTCFFSAHSSQASIFLPCPLQPAPDLPLSHHWLLSPTCSVLLLCPYSSGDLSPCLSPCQLLCVTPSVCDIPRLTCSVSVMLRGTCSASSLISVSPCGLWLRAPGQLPWLSFAFPQVLPSSFLREPHSEPFAEAIPASCQHIRSLALPGLSLQHCWLLVPAVASRLHFSSSLYPACLPLNTFSPQLQLPDFISGVSQSPCLSLRLSVLAYFSSPFLPRAGSGVCPPCAQIVRLLPLAG